MFGFEDGDLAYALLASLDTLFFLIEFAVFLGFNIESTISLVSLSELST